MVAVCHVPVAIAQLPGAFYVTVQEAF